MAKSYLDYDGLLYLWQKIKTMFATKDVATTSANGLMSNTDKSKLNGIATGAEVNQNAFSNITIGSSTVAADSKTDTLVLSAGSNVQLGVDATNDAITISATNTTYSDATTAAHGLMTAADKTKLNGIDTGAEVNQNAFSNVAVGSTTITADEKTDTLTLVGSSPITITPRTSDDTITIGFDHNSIAFTDDDIVTVATDGEGSVSDVFDVLDQSIPIATCSTAAATAAKVATVKDIYGNNKSITLAAGLKVAVIFQYGNTVTSPTLNVNSTGAKSIVYPTSATATAGTVAALQNWGAYEIVLFVYNGTAWVHSPTMLNVYGLYNTKANLASPSFTGTPTAPTAAAGTNTTQIATTAFVSTAVGALNAETIYYDADHEATLADVIDGITGITFLVVQSLPATGVAGTIYLMSNGGSGQNVYDEYIWITSTSKYEKIGSTDVDLSNYISTSDVITNTQIDTIVAS